MSAKEAPVNEIVDMLDQWQPERLANLRRTHPEYADFLRPGIPLGLPDTDVESEELRVRSEICKLGLETIYHKAEELLPVIKTRLQWLNNIQLISQIIVTISGASILVFLEEKHGDSLKWIVGTMTLLAGLLSLVVQHRSGTLAYGENSLSQVFNDLADHKLKAESLLREITIMERLNFSASAEEISQIIRTANEISLEMKKIIEKT